MTVFSQIPSEHKIHSGKHHFIMEDKFPVSPGHLLIISNSDKKDFFELNEDEKKELLELIGLAKTYIEKIHKPNGFNIGMNCGISAGQTVMHFHCHVIPRYDGDMDDPRGGIRHCIEGKGYY
jgi:diadenosine tetraphosphate (Ap4A) HIT family hydrolase